VGDTVKLAYVDQSRDARTAPRPSGRRSRRRRDPRRRGAASVPSRAYVASFNCKGTDQQKTVGTLSGGERNRLHLAKTLKSGGNVLLLDEPTNDLDVDTLRALEEALLEFAGCAVVISHDRWFLDRIATHMLASRTRAAWSGSRATTRLRGRPSQAARCRRRPAASPALQASARQLIPARARRTPSTFSPSAPHAALGDARRQWEPHRGGPLAISPECRLTHSVPDGATRSAEGGHQGPRLGRARRKAVSSITKSNRRRLRASPCTSVASPQ
jgi:hypothetical protein